ncbi:MAG TPA: methyltransferase domain-containing protein, partial [Jiangellaceae bacterium]|nr:methyltransferase domain-containing protein [Jiangellaceae bacterium]
MRRQFCGGCGSIDLHQFLDLGTSPLADRFPATADEPEDRYPLQVAVCKICSLVQLMEIVSDDLLYGADYAFFTGSSPSAVKYFEQYAAWLDGRFGLDGKFVVEVACNDGTLLAEIADRGARALGVEPASSVLTTVAAKGLRVCADPFSEATASNIVTNEGRADLIVANNVAAHVADLNDFFGGMAALLDPGGVAVVEVQYLADLLAGNQFDHVYHEHRYFFSIASLSRVMAKHGLRVRTVEHTPAQGGSIRVTATPATPGLQWMASEPPWL